MGDRVRLDGIHVYVYTRMNISGITDRLRDKT